MADRMDDCYDEILQRREGALQKFKAEPAPDWDSYEVQDAAAAKNYRTAERRAHETTFVTSETGGVKGQKDAQFSRIPFDVLTELAIHYGKGAQKYPDDPETHEANWQKGYAWSLNVDALLRHLSAFMVGEDIDPETGSSHLMAIAWHVITLRWFQLHGRGTDDR